MNESFLPYFTRDPRSAGNAPAQSDWGDVDNLDVDLLAEYLLDDAGLNGSGGVTFDFK